jgi:hypothetical protein
MPTSEEMRLIAKDKKDNFIKLQNSYMNTQYSLWNSLITFNAIILSMVSVLYVVDTNISKEITSWFLVTCSVSIFLIITNYIISKFIHELLSSKHNPNNTNHGCKTKNNNNKGTYKFKIQHLQFFFELIVITFMFVNLFKIITLVINFI